MITILKATALKTELHPAQIFKDAYDYNEIRIPPEEMMMDYEDCLVTECVPSIVVDYCLMIWSEGLATDGQN